MKKWLLSIGMLVAMATPLWAGEGAVQSEKKVASEEFAKIQSLAGRWEGMSKSSHEAPQVVSAEYRVTSGGSAVVEALFAGTPHEMVSVYHDEGGKPIMTHYCMLGNQPKLELIDATPNSLKFEMTSDSHIALKNEMHMHSLIIEWKSPDEILQTWTAFDPSGNPAPSTVISLKKIPA